jgi:hypothetical protein
MSINFMKVHQPNLPHPDYIHKSLSKSKYADSIVENDARIGHVLDKIHRAKFKAMATLDQLRFRVTNDSNSFATSCKKKAFT